MLTLAGYTRLSERDEWTLTPGGKYFFTRNMASIVAFAVGEKYQPGNGQGLTLVHFSAQRQRFVWDRGCI